MNQYKNVSMDVLMERAKELECLYLIDEALAGASLVDSLLKISEVVPLGFRDPKASSAVIVFEQQTFAAKPAAEKGDELQANIIVDGKLKGFIKVIYPKATFPEGESPFLPQEAKLLNTIANRISESVFKNNLRNVGGFRRDWEAITTLLQKADRKMLLYVCEKMLGLLAKTNPNLITDIFISMGWLKYRNKGEINFPLETLPEVDAVHFSKVLFAAASTCLDDSQIYDYINSWIYQAKTYELIKVVDKKDSDVKDVTKALLEYVKAVKDNEMSSETTKRWLKTALIRRFIIDNPKIIAHIQEYIKIEAFSNLFETFICSPNSCGKIGGKGSGLFIASQIIEREAEQNDLLANIKVPKTWYISSDELANLIEYNNLDELNEHKYQDILETRISYPRIIQMLKNARLSPMILNYISQILDDFKDKPIIVRSSSPLEDQIDSSFSGKYKSLFLTNAGTKSERYKQLIDGILEVYASMFSPDSIQYRKERDLLDCPEQMGIMIQEVVGSRVGPYYFPLYAGVAFSQSELRWSPRIKREDGLLRMVMGLGTRAVDRIGDDFPVLVSPGQPNLRVNQSPQEFLKYSPKMMDVIDIENNRFLTLPISQLIKDYGIQIPKLNQVASILSDDFITQANAFTTDYKTAQTIITFDGLIQKTPLVRQLHSVLQLLQEKLGYPVDIEFASDGETVYLLQCRPQSRSYDNLPAAIPADIPLLSTVFTANRYISNGKVTGIKTVVYVDPAEYCRLEKHEHLLEVGAAISELNRLLPRRSFILMGPGRWGSRGDIKLGVHISYSDINNTAMLIEIARESSKYQPELSFGTHFFQDLVEENIKYLPLYPDDPKAVFNQSFFDSSKNALPDILPAYSHLSDVVKVIQIDENYFGKALIVLMNADLERAVAYLDEISQSESGTDPVMAEAGYDSPEKFGTGWKWRHYMAEQIAAQTDMEGFGIKGIYLFGSTNTGTAKMNSDIDLLIHFNGTEHQKRRLNTWLDGWSKALAEINFLKTGYKSDGLLDVHFVTDQDILDKNSYALNISSVYDPALPLRLI